MKTKSILSLLVSKLEKNRNPILNAPDENARQEKFIDNCEEILQKCDIIVVNNVRRIIDYFLFKQKVQVNELIDFMLTSKMISDLFDSKTIESESRHNFDGQFGTQTSAILEQFETPEEVSISRFNNSARYHPTPINSIKLALESLKKYIESYESYIFIDVGSGMGRNLLIASEYPFKRIIGIEISCYLNNIAKSNVEIFKAKTGKCADFELHYLDALNFTFPEYNMVLYFWEPFKGEVADQFIKKLTVFLSGTSIEVYLIFLRDVFSSVENSPVFKKREHIKTSDVMSVSEQEFFHISIYSKSEKCPYKIALSK